MKKILIAMIVTFGAGSLYAQDDSAYRSMDRDRDLQVSGVLISPYRISEPQGRQAVMFGAAAEVFPDPTWSLGLEAIFGVEDRGFDEEPVFLTPGIGIYPLGHRERAFIEPHLRFDVPILLNADNDLGIRGGLGFMLNFADSGLALKYSFDASYFFDTEDTVLNLAHVALAYNF